MPPTIDTFFVSHAVTKSAGILPDEKLALPPSIDYDNDDGDDVALTRA